MAFSNSVYVYINSLFSLVKGQSLLSGNYENPHACILDSLDFSEVSIKLSLTVELRMIDNLSLPACVRFYGRREFETGRILSHIPDI